MIGKVSQSKKKNEVLCVVLSHEAESQMEVIRDKDGMSVSKADRVSVCSDEEMDGWWDWLYNTVNVLDAIKLEIQNG